MAWSEGDDGGNSTRTEGYYPLPFPEEISQTNWITNQALSFIDETPVDQPLYTHISYVQPHPQFHPPERFLERVNDDLIPDPVGYGTDHWNRPDKLPNWRYYSKLYFADFIHIDEQIGRTSSDWKRPAEWRTAILSSYPITAKCSRTTIGVASLPIIMMPLSAFR